MRRLFWLIAATALLLSGCYRVSYKTNLTGGGKRHERWLNYYLFGVVGSYELDLDELCPEGVHAWSTSAAAFGVFDLLTLGIWSPRNLKVECVGGTSK
jgi:hypothetical protein